MHKNQADAMAAREPLLRIAKRDEMKPLAAWGVRAIALFAALVFCAVFFYLVGGLSPDKAFYAMWKGTFGEPGNIASIRIKCWDSAYYAAKLLCIAVALAPAFRMRFWNIGAEGQVLVGALATAIVMHDFYNVLPGIWLYVVMFAVCIVAGAVWGLIPAFFRAKWGTNETLFTLMMNYIAMKVMDFFYNAWKGQNSSLDSINRETKIGYLPKILDHGYTLAIILFVLLAILMYFYMNKTKHGYEIAVVGESRNTARYAGINVGRVIVRTMLISGAICGLCGGLTVMGQSHSISSETTAGGYGFTAIIVAWLAKFNTIGMIFISLLIIFLEKGTGQLGNSYPAFATGAGNVLIGVVLFFIIGSEFFLRYRIIPRKSGKGANA